MKKRMPGGDYREREKIKRRCMRWVERMRAMPREERDFILKRLKEDGQHRRGRRFSIDKIVKGEARIDSGKSKVSKVAPRRKNRS